MASLALTFLLESKELFVNSTYLIRHPFDGIYDVLDLLDARVRLSLQILKYLSKTFNSDQRLKLLEEKIRVTASEAEYSFEECKNNNSVSVDILLSIAHDIDLLRTDLLKTFGPVFFNYEDQVSYVVTSSAFNSYQVHHQFSNRPSYHKKLRDRLCMLARNPSVEKNEIVDFLIAKSKSELGLGSISIGGSSSNEEKRILGRCIYSDPRMKMWFPIRAWVTLFKPDGARALFKGLLHSVLEYFPTSQTNQLRLNEMSTQQLYECLYKQLEDQRYFFVIDNFQIAQEWNKISYSFPNNKNGSRILFIDNIKMSFGVTSKTNLVLSRSGRGQILKMFNNLVFGERSCPKELELMVPLILDSCRGSLPAVFMVANYLSTINQTTDQWKIVKKSLRSNSFTFKDASLGIISALLKASEDISSIHAEETNVYFERCEARNNQTVRLKHLKASSEVVEPNEQVGLEDCLDQLVPELLRSSPQLEKLAITGMAGIGKTTLAKRIFDDPTISYHFHIRGWIGISQFFKKRSLLIQLLENITELTDDEILNDTDDQLAAELYRCLKGRRYLIVMDDMWSIKAWSELQKIFPDDKLGSRILLTSRESNLIKGLNCRVLHRMSLLSEKKSWDLLQKKVFGQDNYSRRLAVIGKQIAEKCEGLPLAIVVVAGVLLKIGKTTDGWKVVAESVCSHVMGSENETRAVFSLSYEHLPNYLKSCFLYMGAFLGGYEIEVRTLIRLWIAEGFIANAHQKSLEDVAEEYLNDLIDRSLLLSGRRKSNGRLKTCRLHDLVQEFCIQEARKEKFLEVVKGFKLLNSEATMNGHHRYSFQCHSSDEVHLTSSKSHAGSALFFRVSSLVVPDIFLHYFDFKLLRVLDLISCRFVNSPTEQIAKLLLLRYLALTALFELPGILFELQKLQTLIINGPWLKSCEIPVLPPEFWRCTTLRYLHLRVVNHLVSPENSFEANLNFLHTLTNITLSSCTHETFASIPNILKLGVCETDEDFPVVGLWDSFFQNLVLLKHIQSLKISCFGHSRPLPLPSLDAFPKGLKKLTLRQSNLPWEAMVLIGDLPNLEVLKLRNNAFQGAKWETSEGGFQYLKYLLIEETDLRYWELESHHFPRLEQLVLKSCEVLEKIPIEIGDIATLTHIKLENCFSSVETSAKDIQEQCNEYGHDIKIQIRNQQALAIASLEETDRWREGLSYTLFDTGEAENDAGDLL